MKCFDVILCRFVHNERLGHLEGGSLVVGVVVMWHALGSLLVDKDNKRSCRNTDNMEEHWWLG